MSRDDAGMTARPWAFVIILGLFLVLTTVYNVITPIYESPDELQHAAFVVWLAEGWGLPYVDPEAPGPWAQEGTQPPLYYWFASRLVGGLPHAESGNLAKLNPYAGIGDPLRPDNKNRVLHDLEGESWPYEARVWFVHLARGLSSLMAAGTLVAVYRLGRIVFPQREGVALSMMGLVAFIPQFLFLSASINNDNLIILISAWVLVLLAGWLCTPRLPGWLYVAGLGLLLGLAALAKFSGALLWPLAGGVLLWLAWREKRFGWLIPAGLLVFGLALALSGWWYVRNLQLYGDLSALGPHLEIMGTRKRLPTKVAPLMAEFRGLRYSFWALFGWFNILAPDPFYWIVDILTVVGLLGFAWFLVQSFRREAPGTRHAILMLIVWSGLVAAALIRWTVLTPASQGRLLYPALPAIALVLVVGWAKLIPSRLHSPVGIAALAIWALWAALCPLLLIKPAYALPERSESLDMLPVAPADLHVRYDNCCELVGYVAPQEPVYPGERVPLILVWQALEDMDQDYSLFVHAATPDGQKVGQLDTYHGGGMYSTSQWRQGELIVDTAYVPIPLRAQGPALLRFSVGLHQPSTSERLPAFTADGQPLDTVFAGETALRPFDWPEFRTESPIDAVFGEQIRLTNVELERSIAQPGEVVTVTLQWEALTGITEDYVGFVHLVDPSGWDVAQDDHSPLNGGYPTRVWSPGTVILDPYRIELATDLEAGTYELWAGLYRPGMGDRLRAVSQETGERWKDDLVHVGTLTITVEGQ